MTEIRKINNTILVTLNKTENSIIRNNSENLKIELIKKLTTPFTNIFIDFNEVEDINQETIDALIAGQRMSVINKGQLSLFNVKEKVFRSFIKAKADHLFFFCDLPKPLSENLHLA